MNCAEYQAEFDRLLDGQVDAQASRHLRAHLEVCPECGAAWRAYEAAWTAFTSESEVEPSSNFTVRVLNEIERVDREPSVSVGVFPRLVRWLAPAAVALTVLAVTVGVWKHGESDGDPTSNQELVVNLPVVQHLDLLSDLDIIANLDRVVPPAEHDPIEVMMNALWNS